MKKTITLFISILFMIGCNTNKSKIETDLEKQGFKGKVKSIKSTTYKAMEKFGEIQKGEEVDKLLSIFNEMGNFTERIYSKNGKIDSKQTYIYNNQKNIIDKKEYDSDGILKLQTTYDYDEKGNKIEENTFGRFETQKTTYKYDDKGREVESLITFSFQGIDGSVELRITKEYDQKGNVIEEKNYNNRNQLSNRNIFTYDERGNRIKEIFIDLNTNESEEKNIYTYDKNNKKIEIQKYISKNLSEKTTIKYDEKGNILEEHIIDFNRNTLFKIVYKNNKIGNPIEKIYYNNEIPYLIEEIEIEYYN